MKLKRILSGVMALALTLSLALPFAPKAQAASFTDISDPAVAENVEVLRMLGVIDGTGDGNFDPDGTLSRAQFCKMAVVMMGKKGAVGQYQTYTIFPDVRASHWAAGYVNLAVKGEEKIISGYPDGNFHPGDEITFGQTVTILMRMLGYKDSDVGAVWPQGYLNAAAGIGLTDGLKLGANAKMTRAQAAQLFCKLLMTDCKDGGLYAETLGALERDVILMDVAATAEDGTPDAIKTHEGKVYKVADRAADASLAGRKGALLLGSNQRVLTFIPDQTGSKTTVTVSEAKASGITDANGKKHDVHSDATVYYRGEKTTYGETFFNLRPGTSVTLYYNGAGRVDYLFAGAAPADEAVIVGKQGSTAGFERLTDSTNYAIYKNGVLARAADLREYDVATYDKATNSIRVSDTRLTGYYADAEPNVESPTKVTVLGQTFRVLPSGADAMANFKIGQQVTLLLTEDNQVAGAVEPRAARGNAVGIATEVSATSATVELFCGLTIKGNPRLSEASAGQYVGQLVKVSSYQKGDQISLSRVTSGNVRGDLDVPNRTLGDTPLADNVRVYDKVGSGPLVSVSLSDITKAKVPASGVAYAEKDYAGRVSILVLNNVTGDGFTYGRYKFTKAVYSEDAEGKPIFVSNATIAVENGDGVSETAECGGGYKNGDFGGLAFYKNQSGDVRLAGTATLTRFDKVSNASWNGSASVTVKGKTYPVAEGVVCYNKTTEKWVTVNQARAFADTATLYVDSVGEKVRIIVVEQGK